MQLRPLMLVCVAIVSGVMSAVHLYLVSSRRQNFISVALEIPVQRVQGSTNLELNIHSLGDAVGDVERNTEAETADHSRRTEADVNEQVAAIPLRHSLGEAGEEVWGGLGRDDGEEYVLFDDKEEEYEAMLDTGEYELKEKDMDEEEKEEEGEPSLPPTTQRHRRYRHQKRRQKDRMRPAVVTGSQTSPVAETQQKLRGSVADVEAEGAVVRAVVGDTAVEVPRNDQGGGPYVISKEEYYMRQATSTYHPPTTHTPHHHTHRNTSHTSYQCSQPPCLQFLSSEERLIFNKCQRRTGKTLEPPPACKCRFRRGVGKKRVAVVSVPGSGNTWMRGLLEKASGLCTGEAVLLWGCGFQCWPPTGSIYCDRSLRNGGFCGEGLRGSSLLAVKTHDSCLQWRGGSKTDPSRPVFDKAIFLIRDPFKTNVAEWNRRVSRKYVSDQTGSTHVKYVSNEALFGEGHQ